jgi:catechol 2,3-dioxygenase-like lactoylglutathione lyase family enzyme
MAPRNSGIRPRISRDKIGILLGCLLAACSLLLFERRLAAEAPGVAAAVTSFEVVVSDLERSRAFFEDLGFVRVAQDELNGAAAETHTGVPRARIERLQLALGSEKLALLHFVTPRGGRPMPSDTRGNDLWFQHIAIVVSDMDRAYAWLRQHRVSHVSSAPQTLPAWNRNAAGISAFYFSDPDGHVLEIIHFPAGKGDPRWQRATDCKLAPSERCLFLGIDHSAITVRDTDRSLALYRDRLGLKIVGASENYGVEQEHLNGVFGAHLRITTLRAASGPGVELLEYLAPRGGRSVPAGARPNDLWHWQIELAAPDLHALRAAATKGPGAVVHNDASAVILRDPDGHTLLFSRQP